MALTRTRDAKQHAKARRRRRNARERLERDRMVVQTWDQVCQDVVGLMDALGIDQASLCL